MRLEPLAVHPLALASVAVLAPLLATAVLTDLRSRTIGNGLNLAVALLAVPWWIGGGLGLAGMLAQIGLAAAMLFLFGALFALGAMGGGDVKLLAALGLWLPLGSLLTMLFWMSLGGGALTLAMLVARRARASAGPVEVPYGVAIAGATFFTMTNLILTKMAA